MGRGSEQAVDLLVVGFSGAVGRIGCWCEGGVGVLEMFRSNDQISPVVTGLGQREYVEWPVVWMIADRRGEWVEVNPQFLHQIE